jgi:glycerophosphoryl diester phosphodiesterase
MLLKTSRFTALSVSMAMALIEPTAAFDLQGHRGARGLMPENTLAGFARAIAIGVTTLETDLAVTRDDVVVLSHDPVLNPDITRDSSGTWLRERGPAIRTLTLSDLKRFDIGRIDPKSSYALQFPAQVPADGAHIPTLGELFALVSASARAIRFNLEIKTSPDHAEETASPDVFADLVVREVRRAGLSSMVTVQSFDWRTLVAVRRLAPELTTSCLTIEAPTMNTVASVAGRPSPWLAGLDPEHFDRSVPRMVAATGCTVWSPFWPNLDAEQLAQARGLGLKVVPWTVNTTEDMQRVLDLKVDGLITDYPDRAVQVLAARGVSLT